MASSTEGQVIKCKAAVLAGTNQKFTIENIEVAPPQEKEVRIKIVASGVCHSDESARKGLYDPPHKIGPIILGHEGAGVVESVGPGVTTVKPGDHVIAMYMPHCGKCLICSYKPNCNVCIGGLQLLLGNSVMSSDNKSRFSKDGKEIYHFMLTSTFTQYTVVHEDCVAKIDPKAPLDKVCLLGCGIPTGYGGAINRAKVTPGSTCAVFGLGGVGLAAVQGCKNAGAKRIFAIDINPAKFDLAKKMGATDVLNPLDYGDKPIEKVIDETTQGSKADFTFECIGNLKTMNSAIESSNQLWGRAVLIGIGVLTEPLPLNYVNLMFGREITGGAFGGYRGRADIPKLVDEYMDGKLKIDEFVTHTLPLEKINEAFDLMKEGKSVRTVLNLWE